MIQGATYIDLPGEPGISSEIDRDRFFEFVVCGPEGLYAIEVKDGRVACRDGVWRYRDRNGGVALSQESPFHRAETALHGLMEDLRANLPEDVLDWLTTGYVAMSRARTVLSLIHRDSG